MKKIFTTVLLSYITVAIGQSVPVQQPVEEQYHFNYWWWVIGVVLALAGGMLIYMLIKKDPKRDAVR